MKNVARVSFILITALWGSYYAITKEALVRIDPVLFSFFEKMALLPIALTLIVIYWRDLNKSVLKRGIILGSSLCLALLTLTVSLKFTDASNTAFFPSLGGIMGAIITSIIFRQSVRKSVWIAGGLSLVGVLIIFMTTHGGIQLRGDLIALLGALFFTVYLFLVDHDRQTHKSTQNESLYFLILGIAHLTAAFWLTVIALLFGDWQHFHPIFPKDMEIIVYIAMGTNFIPFLLATFMQKYIAPLEVAFLSILEPIWASIIAFAYLGELMPTAFYLAGALVVAGAVFYTWSTAGPFSSRRTRRSPSPISRYLYVRQPNVAVIIYPLLLLTLGAFLLSWLGSSLDAQLFGSNHLAFIPLFNPQLLGHGSGITLFLPFVRLLLWFVGCLAFVVLAIFTCISTARKLLRYAHMPSPSLNSQNQLHNNKDLVTSVGNKLATRKLLGDENMNISMGEVASRELSLKSSDRRLTTRKLSSANLATDPLHSKMTGKLSSTVAQRRQLSREQRLGFYYKEE